MANNHPTIRSDLDAICVFEIVLSERSVYMMFLMVDPVARHIRSTPILFDEELLEHAFVLF